MEKENTTVLDDNAETTDSKVDDKFDFDFNYMGVSKSSDNGEEELSDSHSSEETTTTDTAESEESTESYEDDEPSEFEQKRRKIQSDFDKKLSEQKISSESRIQELERQLNELSAIKAAKEELEKEPLAFVYKHIPQLAEKVDVDRYVFDKLKSEFGNEFEYEPSDAHTFGTKSYKYRTRELEIRHQLTQEKERVEREKHENQTKIEARLNTSKEKVMKSRGYTEDDFKKKIEEPSKGLTWDWEMIDWVINRDAIIKQAIEKALKSNGASKNDSQVKSVGVVG